MSYCLIFKGGPLIRFPLGLTRQRSRKFITKNGLAFQLTVQGTKYYKSDDLNKE
jgi:hypothetical protein